MASSIDPKILESLPHSFLDSIPGTPAPPGITPLSPNPESLRPQTLAIGAIFLGLATVFFSIRVYVKLFINKKITLDDYICTLGFALSIVQYGGITLAVSGGAGGHHMWDSSVADLISVPNTRANWLTTVFVTPALGFVKLTFLVQYYQLFWPLRWVRLSCWWGGGFAMAFYLATTITMFILCSPWPGESWVASLLSSHYNTAQGLSIPTGAVGAAVDIFLLALPVRAVISLQLAPRKKFALIIVFLTGALASIASIVGLAYRVKNTQRSEDAEWWVAHVWIWLQIEIFSGVAASCMPCLSKLIFDNRDGKGRWGLSNLTPRRLFEYLRSSRGSKSQLLPETKRSRDSGDTEGKGLSDAYLPKPSITSFNDPYFSGVSFSGVAGTDLHPLQASTFTYVGSEAGVRGGRESYGEMRPAVPAKDRRSQYHDQGIRLMQEVSVARDTTRDIDIEQGIDRRW